VRLVPLPAVQLLLRKHTHQATHTTLGPCWGGWCVLQVVQHSQAAAVAVANEVDVMMAWHHPNLVSAYHFVTWRRRKHPATRHHSGDQVC
jgi:dienelactone hydrolase